MPKGTLIIIGGAEDKGNDHRPQIKDENVDFKDLEILEQLIPTNKAKKHSIEVITSASTVPNEVMADYRRSFRKLGATEIGHIHITDKVHARDPKLIERINNAHAVFLSGGDQFRLATTLGGTLIMDAIRERYEKDKDFIIAGTSAGAMAMSKVMLWEGTNNEAMLKGDVKMSAGFGFLDTSIVDTHFIKRGRIGRLTLAIIMNPSCIGLGLGEDTGLVIKEGNIATCFGSGMVVILDGGRINYTNIATVDDKSAVCAEEVVMHVLTKGNHFFLDERKFKPCEKNEKTKK